MSELKVQQMTDNEIKQHLGYDNDAGVVRFERKNGKYVDEDGRKINTDYLMTKAHFITGNYGAFILEP